MLVLVESPTARDAGLFQSQTQGRRRRAWRLSQGQLNSPVTPEEGGLGTSLDESCEWQPLSGFG